MSISFNSIHLLLFMYQYDRFAHTHIKRISNKMRYIQKTGKILISLMWLKLNSCILMYESEIKIHWYKSQNLLAIALIPIIKNIMSKEYFL